MKPLALFCLLLAVPSPVAAQEKPLLARAIAPYLDDQLLAVLHVDLARLDLDAVVKTFQKAGLPDALLAETARNLKPLLTGLTGVGLKRGYAVFSLAEFPDRPPVIALPLAPGDDGKALALLLRGVTPPDGMLFIRRGSFLIGASARAHNRLENLKPVERPELEKALAELGDADVKLAVLPGTDLRRAFEELSPTLPRELGGGSSTVLTRGLRWLAVGASFPPGASIRLHAQGTDEATAKALLALTNRFFETVLKEREVREFLPDAPKLLERVKPRQAGERVEMIVKEEVLLAVVLPMIRKVGAASDRSVQLNNLKQIGLAFHNYLDTHRTFPAAANHDKQGQPLLSWRVHLLPYLEQDALYKQFKLDQPWDSEHNKKLIARMPKVFASSPKLAPQGRTTLVVPTGPDTAFAGQKGLRIQDVSDGTSNTVLAVDVDDEHGVIWTKPDDWKFEPKKPATGLRRHDNKSFLLLFMDGSVRLLPATVNAKTLTAIVTPSGGEVVALP